MSGITHTLSQGRLRPAEIISRRTNEVCGRLAESLAAAQCRRMPISSRAVLDRWVGALYEPGISRLQDPQRFKRWAEGSTTITPVDGVMCMTQDVPAEEAFESLASRCRPSLLQGRADPLARRL